MSITIHEPFFRKNMAGVSIGIDIRKGAIGIGLGIMFIDIRFKSEVKQ